MRDLGAIEALYVEIDSRLEQARSDAAGNAIEVKRIESRQLLNDQAYFILCWGQLELAINDTCREAIRRRKASPDWNVRRAWDLYNPDDRRLSGLAFEDRAALVLDRAAGKGSAWARLMSYYALRNQIAHGSLLSDRIDISAVAAEFYQIQGALSR
jgi:hypothetical protein